MSYKRRFEYMVQAQVGQVYGPYELEVKWTNATAAIYAAAEEFFPKAEGIGAQWPVLFVLFSRDGKEVGRHNVKTWNMPCFLILDPDRSHIRGPDAYLPW